MVFGKGKTFDAKSPEKSAVNSGEYVGVDPVYQNAANKTDKPLKAGKESPKSEEKVEDKSDTPKSTTPKK